MSALKPLIAVSGKGGTGKTSLVALLVRRLVASGVRPVLAVDADPNACLSELLGLEVPGTMAELREAARPPKDSPADMPKAMQLDQGVNQIVAEGEGFDVLTMGRPEGPGCYCFVNSLLRDVLKRMTRNYAATLIDNQAGMEHLSRLVTATVDTLLLLAEPTFHAAQAAQRILELSRKLPMAVGRRIVVWNKVRDGHVPADVRRIVDESSVEGTVLLPWDERMVEIYSHGAPFGQDTAEAPQLGRLIQMCGLSGMRCTVRK